MSAHTAVRGRGQIAAVGAALLLIAAVLVLALRGAPIWMADFAVYDAAGAAVREGLSLYDLRIDTESFDDMRFTYPPFAALLATPLSMLPTSTAHVLWVVATTIALAAVLWLARADRPASLWWLAGATAGASLLTPVLANTTLGQVNVLLMLALLLDCTGKIPARWQGIATGVAIGIKLWPLVFVVFFLCVARIRAAVVAALSFLATVALGFVVLPGDSRAYWIDRVFLETDRVAGMADVQNQSIPGVVSRVSATADSPAWWLPASAIVVCLGLWAAGSVHRRGEPVVAVILVAFTAVLASPVSWPHHVVWVAPALVWLWTTAWDADTTVVKAIRVAATVWCLVPTFVLAVPGTWRDRRLDAAEQLVVVSTGYVVVLVAVLATCPLWSPRIRRPGAQAPKLAA